MQDIVMDSTKNIFIFSLTDLNNYESFIEKITAKT